MDDQLYQIDRRIEMLRRKMNELAKEKQLTDPEVLSISGLLDQVLLEYYHKKSQHVMKCSL
ncbi:Spo0E family sporulation regulatory protein-aspartic acid phosphatase [Aneurinibacillus sp. REN35]|uniref:Spo0E family sporulation regulatory protein-aspartic acid phosphatase n=1 Tax=Aneurinibacillus sp. REN35 TaxID=3237286 RepID=UPI003526F2CC